MVETNCDFVSSRLMRNAARALSVLRQGAEKDEYGGRFAIKAAAAEQQ
jgi:hypothetical protein